MDIKVNGKFVDIHLPSFNPTGLLSLVHAHAVVDSLSVHTKTSNLVKLPQHSLHMD